MLRPLKAVASRALKVVLEPTVTAGGAATCTVGADAGGNTLVTAAAASSIPAPQVLVVQ